MRNTSALYKRLLAEEHTVELSLVVGLGGVLTDEDGNPLAFGVYEPTGEAETIIPVEQGGPEDGFREDEIFELKTYDKLFDSETPTVGGVNSGQIDASILYGNRTFDRMSELVPYIRLVSADGTEKSDWLQKGLYYIDTREISHNDNGLEIIHLTGFDALLKAQADYPSDSESEYPKRDTDIVSLIASAIGVTVDSRTYAVMNHGYTYGLPVGYTMGEVLSYIAMSYAGNWIITETGQLRLVTFLEIPHETRLLVDEIGYELDFGYFEGELIEGETEADREHTYIIV